MRQVIGNLKKDNLGLQFYVIIVLIYYTSLQDLLFDKLYLKFEIQPVKHYNDPINIFEVTRIPDSI